ncbi:MAG: hypothetical protein ACRD9R_24535, partial [Pyrinomonadaceae bacterium]
MRKLTARPPAATPPLRRAAAVAALAACMLTAPFATHTASAQQQPLRLAIDTYAITNARVVPAAGQEIARGTVVVRNGLVAAVGANVTAPPDARVIDGAGLTVYPGLIDAHTNLGIPAPSAPPRPAGGGGGSAALLAQAQA